MTDMDEVILGLPFEIVMESEESRREFYAAAQALLAHNAKVGEDHKNLWFRSLEAERGLENWKNYSAEQKRQIEGLTETHVLYTWLRKKLDEPNNDQVALYINIGHDWAQVRDLDRDLRTLIDQEEP